jgi:DNA-binding MarR family transcriptional regulator
MHVSVRTENLFGAAALAVAERILDAGSAGAGVSPSGAAALVVLNAQPGIGGTELARRLGLSQPGGTRLAEVLVQQGLVERQPGADGRAVSLRLTVAGRRRAARVLSARQKVMEELLSDVAEADRVAFERVLARVLGRLTATASSPYYLCRLCDEASCTRDGRDCPVELAWRLHEPPASDCPEEAHGDQGDE